MSTVEKGTFFAEQGWYPGREAACRKRIVEFLTERPPARAVGRLHGGIVPHAGWTFSGALACQVFATLAGSGATPETVILLGGHLGPGSGSWIITRGTWPTVLGDLAIDEELATAIAAGAGLKPTLPDRYQPDNTIELQLPFVRYFFPEARLVAAGVPASGRAVDVGRHAVSAARDLGRDVVAIGSTDLTHYGPNYGFSPQGSGPKAVRWVKETNDRRATDLMQALEAETLRVEALEQHFCCCPGATAAALSAARELGAEKGDLLDTLTSYDVHPGSSFVGYAAVVF